MLFRVQLEWLRTLVAVVETGSIYHEQGQWRRRGVQEIELPESVRSVITQRVSRLSPETQKSPRRLAQEAQLRAAPADAVAGARLPDGGR